MANLIHWDGSVCSSARSASTVHMCGAVQAAERVKQAQPVYKFLHSRLQGRKVQVRSSTLGPLILSVCPMSFELQFSKNELPAWGDRYSYGTPAENEVVIEVGKRMKDQGFLTLDHLVRICEWKTSRSRAAVQKNSDSFVREVTRSCVDSNNERFRIEVLTLLDGVAGPTASVILHFAHSDPYPILDYRALWSFGREEPSRYTFDDWMPYVRKCRELAEESGLSMREVDQALWQYSKENQGD